MTGLSHGEAELSEDGGHVRYSCHPHHQLQGQSELHCNGTHWSGVRPSCRGRRSSLGHDNNLYISCRRSLRATQFAILSFLKFVVRARQEVEKSGSDNLMRKFRLFFLGNHNSEKMITTASASTDLRNEMETADQQELNSEQKGGGGGKIFKSNSDGVLTPSVFFTLNLLLCGRFVLTN